MSEQKDSEQTSLRQAVFDYVKKKYKVSPEFPWRRSPSGAVLRHSDNRKWFALVMEAPAHGVGLAGDGIVDVINLKTDDLFLRDMLIKEDGITPAWHMNKLHWISVRLDGSVPAEKVFELIDLSFRATASAKKKAAFRPAKEWVIPANPKYFDIVHAFDHETEIDWKQGAGIVKSDTVFMYVGLPVSAILYQCVVTKTGIPYAFENKNLTIKALMRIRLVRRYAPDQFTFDRLKSEYGIYAVRGPRGIPNSLSCALKADVKTQREEAFT